MSEKADKPDAIGAVSYEHMTLWDCRIQAVTIVGGQRYIPEL